MIIKNKIEEAKERAKNFLIFAPDDDGIRVDADRGELFLLDRIDNYFGVSVQNFLDGIAEIEEVNDDPITLIINSPGGDVFDGITIANIVRDRQMNVRVSGLAASIASVIAVSGAKVVMEDNAMMMVHSPWAMTMGNADDMREMADTLDEIKESLIATYTRRQNVSEEKIRALLAKESWLSAKKSLQNGLIDEISDDVRTDKVHNLAGLGYDRTPKSYSSRVKDKRICVAKKLKNELQRIKEII